MRAILGALVLTVLSAVSAAPAIGSEPADWGVVVSVNDDDTILMANDVGVQLVAVDPFGEINLIRADGVIPVRWNYAGLLASADIRPGDRLYYSVTNWGGMKITDFVYVDRGNEYANRRDLGSPAVMAEYR